ncbi:MAG: penicillin-insensitive murein endopeptidase, partial [Rhodomicrobium sp.]
MRDARLILNAFTAVSFGLAAFAAFAVLGAPYFQSARAEGQSWTASAQPLQAPPPQQPQVPAVPASQPANGAPSPAPASPQKPAASIKKANARELFGAAKAPANLATRSIGFYARGCLAGGKPLPVNGPAWQVMRLSRNRNWGHPSLIRYIERFALDAKEKDGWPGLLVGDLSMPRGGPMPYGHASHQIGLDVDIWYKPAPDHELTDAERETMKMESFLLDAGHVNPEVWKPEYEKLLRRAVSYPEVARIFVNPAIKKWLCDNVKGSRGFLTKITPIMGHDDHFHVRLVCPGNNPGCEGQVFKADEGCGKGLDKWIEALTKPKPKPGAPVPAAAPTKLAALRAKIAASKDKTPASNKKPPFMLGQLPSECEAVLKAG